MTQYPIADGLSPEERAVHRDAWEWFTAVEAPGLGRVTGGSEPAVTPDGSTFAFTGRRRKGLDARRHSTITLVDTASGELRTIGKGCHDWQPRWSPDGTRLAYLSDRAEPHVQQVVWTAPGDLEALTQGPPLPGVPEQLHLVTRRRTAARGRPRGGGPCPHGRSVLVAERRPSRGADRVAARARAPAPGGP